MAYADSTDYEDDDALEDLNNRASKIKANPPPPLSLPGSILRKDSQDSTRSGGVRFPADAPKPRPPRRSGSNGSVLSRAKSSGSISSISSGEEGGAGRDRKNSTIIAQALGLSQTPPEAYGRLGGPGLTPGRSGRTSSSSSGSRSGSAYSRSTASGSGLLGAVDTAAPMGTGKLEKAMETLLEDAGDRDRDVVLGVGRTELSKSKSTGKQKSFGVEGSGDAGDRMSILSGKSGKGLGATTMGAHRSKTLQGVHSPENKPIKLPSRSNTEKVVEGGAEKKAIKRVKVCKRCEKRIEDGRWIQIDGGGVLCERCWKNMYLPKVSILVCLLRSVMLTVRL